MLRLDGSSEQTARHLGDLSLLLSKGAASSECGRGSHALQVRAGACVPHSPHQHRNISALSSAVGVELVQHKKLQTTSCPNNRFLMGAREQQLQHHIVGQQYIRRISDDRLPFVLGLLSSVALEGDRRLARWEPEAEKLLQLVELAVGQRVHGIDDNGLDAPAAAPAEYVVNNGDDIGQAFARSRASGEHIALARPGCLDRIGLVSVKS